MTHHFMSKKGVVHMTPTPDGSPIVDPPLNRRGVSISQSPSSRSMQFPTTFALNPHSQPVIVRETIHVPIYYPTSTMGGHPLQMQGTSGVMMPANQRFPCLPPCWSMPQMGPYGKQPLMTSMVQQPPPTPVRRPLPIVHPVDGRSVVENNQRKQTEDAQRTQLEDAMSVTIRQTFGDSSDDCSSSESGIQIPAQPWSVMDNSSEDDDFTNQDVKLLGTLRNIIGRPMVQLSTANGQRGCPKDLLRKTKSILKKITPQTFDRLSQEFVSLEPLMVGVELTTSVIDAVFQKVIDEPRFCEMCGILCEMLAQIQKTNSQPGGDSNHKNETTFRYHLMLKCQQIFELSKSSERLKDEKLNEISVAETEEFKNKIKNELENTLSQRKSTILGSIRFVGYLCERKLVSKFVAHLCIQHLLAKPNDVDSLLCLCKFLTVVGKHLDDQRPSTQNVQAYFERLNKILQSPSLPKRIEAEIRKLIQLRNNKWQADLTQTEVDFTELNPKTAECFVCFEERNYQKFLSCGGSGKKHTLCEQCIKKLAKKASWSVVDKLVECPVCRSVTLLPGGDPSKLKTKFFLDIICEDCSTSKDIEEQNWCKTCDVSVCSSCVLKNHSSHDVNPWEDYDVPSEYLSVVKKDNGPLKETIVKFCQEICRTLITKVEQSEKRSAAFASEMEKGFGPLKSSTTLNNLNGKEKKLKLIVEILKSHDLCSTSDVNEIIADTISPVKFPSMNEILKFFDAK